jgi:hypothetical protein
VSLKDEALEEAEVLARGEFKLDRARAMEKMSRFQLENPHRYVLELVAAAVCAGAELIHVRNDADDFEIGWDGEHPSAQELESLFDHIFSRSSQPRARMLQHLAQGIHGALGLQPRWVRLERPGLHLDLSNPVEPVRRPSERSAGSFVHVKERFSLDVVREWVLPFDSLYETRLLREAALHCPVPIVINDEPMRKPLVGPPPLRDHLQLEQGCLWLDEDLEQSVALVRDGIVVGHERVVAAGLCLAGWVDAGGLELNASRSKVVQDKSWKALGERLARQACQLLERQLDAEVAAFPVAALRQAALAHLLARSQHAGGLKTRALMVDALKRSWSLADLLARERILTFRRPAEPAPELPDPQFRSPEDRSEAGLTWRLLQARCGNRLRDEQGLLEQLARGRSRRLELLRARVPLRHTGVAVQRSFEVSDDWGSCQGSAAWGGAVPPGEGSRVELRVDGLPVEVIALELPGGLCLRIESPDLKAGPAFDRVVRDEVFDRVAGVARLEGERLLEALAQRCPQHPEVQQAVLAYLARGARGDWTRLARRLSPPFLQAGLFEGPGGELSLGDLLRWLAEDGRVLMAPRQTELPADPGRLVFADPSTAASLRKLLGKGVRDASQDLEDQAARERHRAAEPRAARLVDYVVAKAELGLAGLTGEVGFTVHAASDETRVRVLHQGVDLGELSFDAGLPGSVAVIEWAQARPNARWDGLQEPGASARTLRSELDGPLRGLLLGMLHPLPEPAAALPIWLAGALRRLRPLPDELARAPLFPRVDGSQASLRELEQAGLQIGGLDCVDSSLAGQVPADLGGVLVLDASRRRVLTARLGATVLRDARPRIEARQEARRRFLMRPTEDDHPPMQKLVALQRLQEPGLTMAVGLSVDLDHEWGLKVQVQHEGRQLTTLTSPFPVPALATLGGEDIQPNALYTDVLGPTKAGLLARAAALAEPVAETWLSVPALPPLARLRLLRWQLESDSGHPRRAALEDFPLFPSMDGRIHKLSELRGLELVEVPKRFRGQEAPDERAWLLADREIRATLKAAGLEADPGSVLLEAYAQGQSRREELPLKGVHVPGDWSASALIRRDGAEHFLGLGLRWSRQGALEWLVQRRVLDTESVRFGAPVRMRIEDPGVRATPSFTQPMPGKALEDARARSRLLADAFMIEIARALGGGGSWRRLTLLKPEVARQHLVRWAAPRRLGPEWEGVGVLPTSDGRWLDLAQLREVASRGALRVVPPGTIGRSSDLERPVLVAGPALREALGDWRGTEDYSQQLAWEEKARLRADADPVVPERPSGPEVLLDLPAPGSRQGWLQVHRSGRSRLTLHVDWRELSDIPHRGPVPFVGHVSDGAIEPDGTWSGPRDGVALEVLRRELEAASEQALEGLVEGLGVDETHLWLVLFQRAFRHRRDIPKAARKESLRGRMASRPLFLTGSGERLSAARVVELRKPPRWIPADVRVSSGDEERPFLCVERSLISLAISVFGGDAAEAEARARLELLERRGRRKQPFELPPRRRLARAQREGKRFRLLAGLDAVIEQPGRVAWRVEGVPLASEELPAMPGLVAVIELPAGHHDEAFERPRGDKARDAALHEVYAELIAEAAGELRASWTARQRLVRMLPALSGRARRAWLACPLLQGPGGVHSLQEVRDHPQVCLGEVEAEGALVLLDEAGTRELLVAVRAPFEELETWRLRQAVRRSQDQVAASRRRLAERSKEITSSLFAGLPVGSKVEARVRRLEGGQGPRLQALLEDPESDQLWLLIWGLADRELLAAGCPDLAAELALRVGERLDARR